MSPINVSSLHGRRVLIATLGSLGDLYPMLALGNLLKSAGAQVHVATSDLYRERVSASGLGFLPLGESFSAAELATQVQRMLDNRHGPRLLIRDIMMPMTRQTHAQLLEYCETHELLISGEVVYAAPVVAAQRGIPWVSVTLSPMTLFSVYDPPVLPQAPWLQPGLGSGVQTLLHTISRRWCYELDNLRQELGLDRGAHPLFEAKHSPTLSLSLFSPLLGAPQADWPASMVACGFLYHQEADHLDAPLEAFLRAGPAPVVFTLGSAAVMSPGRFFIEALAAVKALGLRAVFLHGDSVPPPALPPQVLGVAYAPHGLLFQRAAAVVHAGGVGTTARALAAGKPMLVVPQANDQPDNAARAVRLGVALQLSRQHYRKSTLIPALARLQHDPQLHQRAHQVAIALAQEDAPSTVLGAIATLFPSG